MLAHLRISWMHLCGSVLSLAFLVAVCLCAGCDTTSARLSRQTTNIAEVPDNVMDAAKKELPGVEFADAWKNVDKDGKLHSYEIRGRTKNGKTKEARVSPSGEILEVE
jgi:hypothetical protein